MEENNILKTPKAIGGCFTPSPRKGEEGGTYPIARWEDGDAVSDVKGPEKVGKRSV